MLIIRSVIDVIRLGGVAVFGIGAHSLLGFFFGHEEWTHWNDGIGMALNTSVAFVITGATLFLIGNRLHHK